MNTPNQSQPRIARTKILSLEAAKEFAERFRREGKTLVMANGCFDLLHGGHVSYLEAARAEGDALIVGLNSDASERAIKGEGRPIVTEADRAELVAAMGAVDAVVIFEEPNCERLLRELRPAVHAKGTDYTTENVPERAVAIELGIRIAITGNPKENNSKDIIRTVKQSGSAAG